jgi:two-component system, cell cycle sensor histidine kinase and response regulator CckA
LRTPAGEADDAVEVATKHVGSIDLLVTDVIMPLMLGTDAAEKIRVMYPSVRVLFMSGYTGGLLGQRVLEKGVHLIDKPFTEASLLAKLGEVLEA